MSKSAGLIFGVGVLVAVAIFVINPSSPGPEAAAPASGASAAGLPPGHPEIGGAEAQATAEGPFATVVETLASGGYTYARVAADGEDIWVAGPTASLEVGQEISLAGAMGMENFHAASLDRTFESILFLNGFAGRAAAPEGQSGTALEVIYGGGYTYVRVDLGDSEEWIAGMGVAVSEGQTVAWQAGSPMENFASPSLERTFPRILFVDGLRVEG
ncbi:MAG: hypothetical protein RQ751_05030 [Longimicrobiales bacterium]|nr:hypothetical protein [Longimicrobiales bacterium]